MSWTVAADESTAGRYLLAATFVPNSDIASVRQQIAGLRSQVPSWRHMSKVNEQLRIRIATLIAGLPAHTVVYDAGGGRTHAERQGQRARRDACLQALVSDIADLTGDVRLVLDSHDTEAAHDRRAVFHAARAGKCDSRLNYVHLPEQSEPLILIADAAAWCFAKGGTWPGRLGVAAERRDLAP